MGRNVFVIAFVELSLPVFSDSDALFPWRERGTQGNARIGTVCVIIPGVDAEKLANQGFWNAIMHVSRIARRFDVFASNLAQTCLSTTVASMPYPPVIVFSSPPEGAFE